MIRSANGAVTTSVRMLDFFALALALPIACLGHRLLAPWLHLDRLLAFHEYGVPLALALVAWPVASWISRVYDPPLRRSDADDVRRILLALGGTATGLVILAFVLKRHEFSRLLVGLYFVAALAMMLVGRVLIRISLRVVRRAQWSIKRFVVVGSGGMAREIVEAIGAHPEWGLDFAGFIRLDDEPGGTSKGVLGRLSQLERILEDGGLDQVIFAVPRERLGVIEPAIGLCAEQGIEVQISLDILRVSPSKMSVVDLDGMPTLALTRTPSSDLALAAKRIFDVAASLAVLVAAGPVLVGVALAISLDSPGPILFRQRRVGLNGRPFWMLKFRSMYLDAEARLEALRGQNEMTGPVFKMRNDPRVTRVGRFLRRTSLDEFPQFLNVLRGEMSVVGPRPPIPSEVQQYKRWQRRRLSVKPGITCVWQISGRNDIDFDRWMELDLEYIDNWSLWQDMQICLKTIPAVLGARGAR